MEEKKNSFTLDGVEYDIEGVSEKARYLVGQLNALHGDKQTLAAKMDVVETAENGFIDKLRNELELLKDEEEREQETGA